MEKMGVVRFEFSEALGSEGSVEFSILSLTSFSILFASLLRNFVALHDGLLKKKVKNYLCVEAPLALRSRSCLLRIFFGLKPKSSITVIKLLLVEHGGSSFRTFPLRG